MFVFCSRIIKLRKNTHFKRYFASNEPKKPANKYTDTINLPKTKFPQRLSATKRAEIEKKLNEVR